MNKNLYILFAFLIIAFSACKKDNTGSNGSTLNKFAPDGFEYKTTKDVSISLTLQSNNFQPLKNVIVNVYLPGNTGDGNAIYTGATNASGVLKTLVNIPASYDQLVIDPNYIGLVQNAVVKINNNSVTATLGGVNGFSGDVVTTAKVASIQNGNSNTRTNGLNAVTYGWPSPYTSVQSAVVNTSEYPLSLGRPKYIETSPGIIDQSLLSTINASFPSGVNINTLHPQYMATSAESNINVTIESDVYLTFVSQGGIYPNTLGYYTYNTSNPPTNAFNGKANGGIDSIKYVFPNATPYGGGGGLKSGDKVKLGHFKPGTTIAFVLMFNSWTGSSINTGNAKYFSDQEFNPEIQDANKKHSVLLYDRAHSLFVVGFEDLNREGITNGYVTDNDFNDLVFYVNSTITGAISDSGVQPADTGKDTDGDGFNDVFDAFPNDATKSYLTYFPSKNGYARIAFEDNFPFKGDYDMNDLVVDYRYTGVCNNKGELVTLQGDYNVMASGASFKNGFGVQLAYPAGVVKSVTGQSITANYIKFAASGVEDGQSRAVFFPFDNSDAMFTGGSYLVNTSMGKNKVQAKTCSVSIIFTTPQELGTSLSSVLMSQFLVSNLRRGYEIHLPGQAMTDKGDKTLFGTGDDNSPKNGSGAGTTYVSKENLPWAISFNDNTFTYPTETSNISTAYPHFAEWASSGGVKFTDWYSNLTTGYRAIGYIYTK